MKNVEEFLRGFCGALAAGKMYPVTHSQFIKILDVAYESLHELLSEREELIIGIIENELVFEDRVLFQLSQMLQLLIIHAKKKTIEKIHFHKAISKEDLTKFISFLLSSVEITENVQDHILRLGINTIKVSRLTTPEDEKKKEDKNQGSPYEKVLNILIQYFENLLTNTMDPSNVNSDLKFVILNILDKLIAQYSTIFSLDVVEKYDQEIVHALNVGIFSIRFATKLGFVQEEVIEVASAALLCNIGKIASSKGISRQSNYIQMKGFPEKDMVDGTIMLLRYEQHLGELPVIVTFEHKLLYETQKKRATGLFQNKQHTVSMIVSICDFYCRAMEQKSSAGGLTTQQINYLMAKEKEGYFNPHLLNKFFKMVAI